MHLHHLALGATNVDLIADFYSHAFSLQERSRQDDEIGLRSVWLELDPGILMIERVDVAKAGTLGPNPSPGLFLIAFKVSQTQRKLIEEQVLSLGATIDSRTKYSTYFRDPENNRVAISTHSLHL